MNGEKFEVSLVILGRPKGFKRHIKPAGKRGYNPADYEAYKQTVIAQILESKPDVPLEGPIEMDFWFVFPTPKNSTKWPEWKKALQPEELAPHCNTPDMDNLEKAVLDAMNSIYYGDDRQVYKVNKIKTYGDVPRTEITIFADWG